MAAVGAWLIATWNSAGVAAFALKTAASMALNFAVAKLTAPAGPRPQEISTEARSSNAKRFRHLGRVRASGALVFYDWCHDEGELSLGGRRLYKLIAVAEGGMQDVLQWYLDGEPVSVDADGWVTTPPWNGPASVRLRFRKGIQGDQWDGGDWPDLRTNFPDAWTTDHRLRGIGTILATFDAVETEDIPTIYPGGDPEVSALILGAPNFWSEDNTTILNSRNPVVHLSDVLCNPTYGPLESDDLTGLSTARSSCLASVPTAGGTRPRYQSGLSYALAEPIKDTAQKLLDAMGGRAWITPDGKMTVEAGVWNAPTVTIEERHIVEMDYGAGTERISRVTSLMPTYVAPQVYWQETNADTVEDVQAIARWGEGEPKGIDLLAVQHHGQAAHLAVQQLAKMNPQRRMTIKVRSMGFLLIGEIRAAVNIPRLGLNNTPFWIDSLNFDGTNFTVELLQADPAAIEDIAISREGSPPPTPGEVSPGTTTINTPITNVEVITSDGPPYIRVEGNVEGQPGFRAMAQYRISGVGRWVDMTREDAPTGMYSFRTAPLQDLREYDVRTFFGVRRGSDGSLRLDSTPVVIEGVDVVENTDPPSSPVIVSATGAAGGTLTVTFMPDLGVNYRRTGLYRAEAGGAFETATFIKWAYDTSAEVTMTAPIPISGARFWLQSENPSQQKSSSLLVGTYT